MALSIQAHYDIHFSQGDWGACRMIARRLDVDPRLLSDLARKIAIEKIKDGSHTFLGNDFQRKNAQKRVSNGTHNFLGPDSKRYTGGGWKKVNHHSIETKVNLKEKARSRVARGDNKLGEIAKKNLERGTHASQIIRICPHCKKEGKGGAMLQHHFDRCKKKKRTA